MHNIRNARYNAVGSIDVDFEHPGLGWIPYTADRDNLSLGREIYDLAVQGVVAPYGPPLPITDADVNAERQRRIVVGTVINGVCVTGRDVDARNLMSLALIAQMRIAAGDDATPTTFRDGDNVDHDLTPPQIVSMYQESAAFVSALYQASWDIKAMDPIPADFAADQYWP